MVCLNPDLLIRLNPDQKHAFSIRVYGTVRFWVQKTIFCQLVRYRFLYGTGTELSSSLDSDPKLELSGRIFPDPYPIKPKSSDCDLFRTVPVLCTVQNGTYGWNHIC